MNIIPITKESPSCFGVVCLDHMKCVRYHAIDGSKPGEHRIYMCDDEKGDRPLFVPVEDVA